MNHLRTFVAAAAILAVVASMPALAADSANRVTFTKDVLPVLQENCQTCHRPAGRNMSGMVAPMSLMTYREVRPWSKAIAKAVGQREMPPWFATDATHGIFRNERTLTQEEIDTIVSWVEQGAPRGNPADAPEPMTFPEGWYMDEPDLVLSFEEPFFVDDDVQDLYHSVTVPVSLDLVPEDKWLQAMEFSPGSEVVHHVIAYLVKDNKEGGRASRSHLGGLAPGTDPADFPEGYGKLFEAGSDLIFAMHYHKEPGPGTGMYDNTSVAMKFHDKPVLHQLETSPISYGPFEIPPNHGEWRVGGARYFNEDTDLIALMPHMHLRGAAAKYTAYYPDGSTEVLLEVPKYDFNWQTSYFFEDIKTLPAGTRVEWEIEYDNSQERAERVGFNSDRAVSFGSPTTDEMDLGWMTFSPSAPRAPEAEE